MIRPSAVVDDLGAAWRQHRSLSRTGHRPWPLPRRSWFIGQSWLDLLFAHWRVDPELLGRVVPPQLPLDVIDGSAWIGVTPFELRAFHLRLAPPAPIISAFLELNVRTYVTVGGKPGIYFLSLDAASRLAVSAARRAYRFPYFHASMAVRRDADAIEYRSTRRDASGPPAELSARYRGHGPGFNAPPGSLEWSLIERYCAYTLDGAGAVLRAEIHHPPWELRRANATFSLNTMTESVGIPLEGEPLLHHSPRQDVVIWTHARAVAS
jgi:uncharacterized protein YqjF (DUF2071 family)